MSSTAMMLLEMDSLPGSLVIIGGGVIGLEFAQIFKRLNVAVSVVEMMPHILPTEDSDIAKQLEKSMKQEGVDIYTAPRYLALDRPKEVQKKYSSSGTIQKRRSEATKSLLPSAGVPLPLSWAWSVWGLPSRMDE